MGSGGSNRIAPALHFQRKTFRRDRHHPPTSTVPILEGTVTAPSWLAGEALELFEKKVAVYQRRGQAVIGLEGVLAVYVSVEADLIACRRRKRIVPAGLVAVYRQFAREFLDTPAAQYRAGTRRSGTPAPNRFVRNVIRDPMTPRHDETRDHASSLRFRHPWKPIAKPFYHRGPKNPGRKVPDQGGRPR
jgi:hypothetical protein